MPDSNTPVTQADRELLDRLSLCITDDERLFYIARHRQSSSNAGGVDVGPFKLTVRGEPITIPKDHPIIAEIAASLSTPTAEPMGEGTTSVSQSHFLPGDVGMREALSELIEAIVYAQPILGHGSQPRVKEAMRKARAALSPQPGEERLSDWRDSIIHPNNRLLFRRMAEVAGIDIGTDDIATALRKVAALTPSALSGDAGEGE